VKTLYIIRHAKSEQGLMLNDFDRPLNDRGKKDAPEMARRLLQRGITIDAFISSPAKRAKKTAELFAKEFKRPEDQIIYKSELYHAPADVFTAVISKTDDSLGSIAIFSHNPGITVFVNSLTHTKVDNMPTCAVFAVQLHTLHWKDIEKCRKDFLFLDYPKL
jgi:phosphohistidine phosphatase